MAIRKFRKNMKPIIWVVTIFFFISLIAGYAMSFRGNNSSNSQVAFKLNGKKVTMMEAQRSMAILSENYKRYLGANVDPELLDIVTFNELINKTLLLEMADKLKIKVSSSEVTEQMNRIREAFPDKEQFRQALLAQGYTTKTLESEIKENIILQKVSEAIGNEAKITKQDVEGYYSDYRYTTFQGKSFDEVSAQIEQSLKLQKSAELYARDIATARQSMKLDDVDKNFDNYLEKEEFEFDGVKVSNLEYAKRVLNSIVMTRGDLEQAKEIAKESLDSEIKLLKLAEDKGVKVDAILPLDIQISEAVKELYTKLKSEVTYTTEDLKAFFEETRINYDTIKSADADIAILKIAPSEKDDELAKERAEKLLKEVNKDNFADMAKQNSDGPSGPNGGALGTFSRGDMVKPFEDAAFSGVVGEVYPEVVKTQFGYHLIFVEGKDEENDTVTASHILVIPEASKETLEARITQVEEIMKDLTDKTITFEELKNDKDVVFSEKIDGITTEGYIPGLGYNEELARVIFNAPLNEVGYITEQKDYIIFKKLSEIEAKNVDFSEVENQVKQDYINMKAQEALKELEDTVE